MPGKDIPSVVQDAQEAKDSVSIWFVRQALAGLTRRGRDPAPLLAAAAIPESLLQSDQSRISAESFGALWLAVAAELDDELFGLDSRRMKVGSFAVLCRGTARAPNLRTALHLALQFFGVIMDDARVSLGERDGMALLAIEDLPGSGRPEHYKIFAHETVLIMLHGLMCWLIGRRIPIFEARFAYPRPPWWQEYRSMYSTELGFDAARSSLSIESKVLDAPVTQDEASVREFLREAPHNFIVKFKDRNSWSARIRRRLRGAAPADWPDFAEVADEFEVAPSTLHRKLDQEGVTFRGIKDALRRDLAIDRLTHSSVNVAQIASELGFAEPSAFHRAFKQWTGVRPGDYRRRQLDAA
ncbi:MAG: AraC family transcriptional regulator [Panacagrimonas sp.]